VLDTEELSKHTRSFYASVALFKAVPADDVFHFMLVLVKASLIAPSLKTFVPADATRFSIAHREPMSDLGPKSALALLADVF
jgi:hypothetical protein